MRLVAILVRLVRYGHLDSERRYGVFQLARCCSHLLRVPSRLRWRVRRLLAGWQFAQAGWPDEHVIHDPKVLGDIRRSEARRSRPAEVRPAFCGLQPGLVSVVLPVYNHAVFLDASIRSVLAQTYRDFELIIIDDGSTDDVDAVLLPYLDHPRVRCFRQPNQKLPAALSNGFDLARGEFWTWTSADNLMAPDMLAAMVGKLMSAPRLGMVYADYLAIDARDRPLADKRWRAHNRPDPDSGAIRLPPDADRLNAVADNFIGPCFMYRGWIGRCIGDYDQWLGVEDYDYWMRINAHFEVRHLGRDDLLYRYRVHDNSLSAHAAELDIPGRLRALMAHEKERARYVGVAPELVVDAEAMTWLASFEGVPGRITPWAVSMPRWRLARADLLFISSKTALANLARIAGLRVPVAILFVAGSADCRRLQPLLAQSHCIALTDCQQVAVDIRQLAPCCPILDAEADQAVTALHAFMRNRLSRCVMRQVQAGERIPPVALTRQVS